MSGITDEDLIQEILDKSLLKKVRLEKLMEISAKKLGHQISAIK
jgi:hypothetical protein